MKLEEKILLLGSLFHDVGKFEQRVVTKHVPHSELGVLFFNELKEQILPILGDEESFKKSREIIAGHHTPNLTTPFVFITKQADHLSASERVGFNNEDDWKDKWSHKFMTSLFSKIYLNDPDSTIRQTKYYAHQTLTKKNYKILIPQYETEKDIKESFANYPQNTFDDFKNDVKSVLSIFENEDDFTAVINLLLTVIEKYMWCIPDFTGSDQTDISLFNHLKDVAGLSHAILKSDIKDENLNLIIGDLPGIQNYIFNVAFKKPAKILRGRSIIVQILTRHFATIILNKLGLTDASLIMLAGGKFYIIAQNSNDFSERFNEAIEIIEDFLIKNFNYQLSFSSVAYPFNYNDLKNKKITFGDVIDEASYKLLLKRNQPFKNVLFEENDFDENLFILSNKYIEPEEGSDSNSVKCAVTGLPILQHRRAEIEGEQVDKQVLNEYKIGCDVTKSNVVVEFSSDYSEIVSVKNISNYSAKPGAPKILLNPELDELLKKENLEKGILKNTQITEVANYTTKDEDNPNVVMDFTEIEKKNNGAQFMTLIKGDVDNLGLIISSGLVGNKSFSEKSKEPKDLTGISRTTTLSNHLKYFFSFSLNGFLEDWEKGNIPKDVEDNYISDQTVYTVFAGGDDLMLICPQSASLKLVNALNKTFSDFVCDNPEVHISYSLTNFKHNTPIRIVADIAEENQTDIKSTFKNENIIAELDTENFIFYHDKDKAGIKLYDTKIKNSIILLLLKQKIDIISWVDNSNNKVSKGILRNLLYFAKIMKDFIEKKDTRLLMWHPKLTYMINRLLKKNEKEYFNDEISTFFESALKINKSNQPEAKQLESILFPLVCEAIYGTRNSKGE